MLPPQSWALLSERSQPPQKAALIRVLSKAGGSAALKAVRAAVGSRTQPFTAEELKAFQ